MYPPDRSVYPVDVFDQVMLDKYNDNKALENETAIPRMATPRKGNASNENPSNHSTVDSNINTSSIVDCHETSTASTSLSVVQESTQEEATSESNVLSPVPASSSTSTPKEPVKRCLNKSFECLLSDSIMSPSTSFGNVSSTSSSKRAPSVKNALLLTTDKIYERAQKMDEEKRKKEEEKEKKRQNREMRKLEQLFNERNVGESAQKKKGRRGLTRRL